MALPPRCSTPRTADAGLSLGPPQAPATARPLKDVTLTTHVDSPAGSGAELGGTLRVLRFAATGPYTIVASLTGDKAASKDFFNDERMGPMAPAVVRTAAAERIAP